MTTATVERERRDPASINQIVNEADITTLGSVAGATYISVGDSEFTIGTVVSEGERLRPDGRYLRVPDMIDDGRGGQAMIGTKLRRLAPTPAGSYLRVLARQERRAGGKARNAVPKVVGVLALLPILAARRPTFVSLMAPAPMDPPDLIVAPGVLGTPAPRSLMTKGRARVIGTDDTVAFFESKGVIFDWKLDRYSYPRGVPSPELAHTIRSAWPLMSAKKHAGKPLKCTPHDREAIDLAEGSLAPLCEECVA